jgi:hypothetical protein
MITLPNKPGLVDFLRAQGWTLRIRGDQCIGLNPSGLEDDAALQLLVNAYDGLAFLKAARIAAIKLDGLSHVRAVFPSIASFDDLKLVSSIIQSILPAARSLTPDMTKAAAIFNAGQAAIAAVNAAATAQDVAAVVPAWPA